MKREKEEDIKHIIRKICDCPYYNKKIIHINNELEVVENELIGISSFNNDECYIENKKPFTHQRILELIYKEQELIKKRDSYSEKILKLENLIEKLNDEVKEYIILLYILQKKHSDVAKKKDFSRQAIYKRINKEISKFI